MQIGSKNVWESRNACTFVRLQREVEAELVQSEPLEVEPIANQRSTMDFLSGFLLSDTYLKVGLDWRHI